MKKINNLLLALLSVFALAWTACDDEVEYTPAGLLDGNGVYFPTSTQTSYEVEGTSGTLTFDVMRTLTTEAQEATLNITYGEGAESVFSIPASVNFAAGDTLATLTVQYDNLVQGTTYTAELSFADGTPYAYSTINLSVVYPNKIEYEWEKVSENAIYTDNLFSMYGGGNYQITGITVEKAKGYDMYRFKSPYDNAYMDYMWGEPNLFPADFEAPYIILDGETYKDEAPGKFYIAITPLGFKMTDGVGVSYDPEWNTFGSIAGKLSAGGSAIPPTSTDYPLGTFDENKQNFNLGAMFHNLDGYGYYIVESGFSLALDPTLLSPDYDRDYTWKDVTDATGFFTSELMGESWMQAVQVSEEDPTFYRMTNPYSDAEKAHLYFYINEEGNVSLPRGQNVGLTSFGTPIYVEGTAGASSWDATNEKLTLGLTLYLADENGKKTADVTSVTETFLWGQTEMDQLLKGKKIDDYVGTWQVPFTDGTALLGYAPVTLTKKDETTLIASGLSATGVTDDVELQYNASNGLLTFTVQDVAPMGEYEAIAAPMDYNTISVATDASEKLVGGLKKDGSFLFINDEANKGVWNSICFLAVEGGELLGMLTDYAELAWTPLDNQTKSASMHNSIGLRQGSVKVGNTPRRSFDTDLQIEPQPVKGLQSRKTVAQPDHNLTFTR